MTFDPTKLPDMVEQENGTTTPVQAPSEHDSAMWAEQLARIAIGILTQKLDRNAKLLEARDDTIETLRTEVEEWRCASMLNKGGDPSEVTPADLERSQSTTFRIFEDMRTTLADVDILCHPHPSMVFIPAASPSVVKDKVVDLMFDLAEARKALDCRAGRALLRGEFFLMVKEKEPYFINVYREIRRHEQVAGTWTDSDEEAYLKATTQRAADV